MIYDTRFGYKVLVLQYANSRRFDKRLEILRLSKSAAFFFFELLIYIFNVDLLLLPTPQGH